MRGGKQHVTQETSEKAYLKIVLCVVQSTRAHSIHHTDIRIALYIYTDTDNSSENTGY